MPLGNLTSQFFANVYLNELDQFVKHKLKVKYYIRYVDDFIILHNSKEQLEIWKKEISTFLENKLKLKLHPDKSKILRLKEGINFLGFRNFYHHRLLRKSNLKNFERSFEKNKKLFKLNLFSKEKFIDYFEGWCAYAKHGSTYKLRNHLLGEFGSCINFNIHKNDSKKKYYNLKRKFEKGKLEFSVQKTLFLLLKGARIKEISKTRKIKESTVWNHLENLIEHNQLHLLDILSDEKIHKIVPKIRSKKDSLRIIKNRLKGNIASYNEIACVLVSLKKK